MDMEMAARIAAVLETLDETEGGSAPSGFIYTALGMPGLSGYTAMVSRMADAGLVTRSGDVVAITAKGRGVAAQIRDARGGDR